MGKQLVTAMGLAFCCACAGPEGSGSLVGAIDGAAFPIIDVVSATSSGTDASLGVIAMSTKPDLCNRLAENTVDSDEHFVIIEVGDVDSATQLATAPMAAGVYPIATGSASGPAADFNAIIDGSNCSGVEVTAASGVVTLSYANGSAGLYNGSFDIVMGGSSDDHVTGTFSPENCPELALLEGGGLTGTPTCQ